MPFIENKRRKPLLKGTLKPEVPGDLCFLEYVKLMTAWRKQPRWTTIHNEFKRLFQVGDEATAKFLAFLVFFSFYGMSYEREKIRENGDI